MKKTNIILVSLLLLALVINSCQNDDLPEANFNLDAVTVFSGEVAHEKASLVWQKPTGNLSPDIQTARLYSATAKPINNLHQGCQSILNQRKLNSTKKRASL